METTENGSCSMSKDTYHSKQFLAERWGVSKKTLDSMCSKNPKGLPRFIKTGAAKNSPIRFPMSEIIKFEKKKLSEAQQFGDGEAPDNRDLDQLLQEL